MQVFYLTISCPDPISAIAFFCLWIQRHNSLGLTNVVVFFPTDSSHRPEGAAGLWSGGERRTVIRLSVKAEERWMDTVSGSLATGPVTWQDANTTSGKNGLLILLSGIFLYLIFNDDDTYQTTQLY